MFAVRFLKPVRPIARSPNLQTRPVFPMTFPRSVAEYPWRRPRFENRARAFVLQHNPVQS